MNRNKIKEIIEASRSGNPTLVSQLTTKILNEKIKKLIIDKKKSMSLCEDVLNEKADENKKVEAFKMHVDQLKAFTKQYGNFKQLKGEKLDNRINNVKDFVLDIDTTIKRMQSFKTKEPKTKEKVESFIEVIKALKPVVKETLAALKEKKKEEKGK
jgi:hypothetical protein